MLLDDLVGVIETLKERIATHGASLRENETRTRMALIDPLLQALGWDTSDPDIVVPEYEVSGSRADYALLKSDGNPTVLVEAKKLGEPLTKHRPQMAGYAVMSGISYAGLTDGNHWEMYDVFRQRPSDRPRPLEENKALQVCITDTPSYQCALSLSLLRQPNLGAGQPVEANTPVLVNEIPNGVAQTSSPEPIAPQRILTEVAVYYGLTIDDLVSQNRSPAVSNPRQMAMYLLNYELKLPSSQVGRLLGGRNHSTVIHGVSQVYSKMKEDARLIADAQAILEKCGGASSQTQQS